MRALAFTDIHNDWFALKHLLKERAHIYLCAGDLTYAEKNLETAAKILEPIADRLYIVPGNNERPETLERYFRNVMHGRVVVVEGIRIGGIGGAPRTPWHTLFEWDDDFAYELLQRLGPVDVFVSHAPPSGTELSRTHGGMDAGSEAVRWYIDEYKPELAVVGHVHERAGVEEMLGRTRVVNPGPRGMLLEI